MISFRSEREKEVFLELVSRFGDPEIQAIAARGDIAGAPEARALARFYWRVVDATVGEGDDIEHWLERILDTLFSACGRAGYGDIWDEEVPG